MIGRLNLRQDRAVRVLAAGVLAAFCACPTADGAQSVDSGAGPPPPPAQPGPSLGLSDRSFPGALVAPSPAAGLRTFTPPEVIHTPNQAEMGAVYPEKALGSGVSGRAVVVCETRTSTVLESCRIQSETPVGYGFGDAALKAATLFRVRPATFNGQPEPGGRFRFPMRFRIAESQPVKQPSSRPADLVGPPFQIPPPTGAPRPGAPTPPAVETHTRAAFWLVAAFASIVLAGMPAVLLWPESARRRRRRPLNLEV